MMKQHNLFKFLAASALTATTGFAQADTVDALKKMKAAASIVVVDARGLQD